ncbi:MAG: hypothetical protein P1U36_09845 [Legionellaceae bacterium]|nr:hypothetical protein [Legionellaceae bacterium]
MLYLNNELLTTEGIITYFKTNFLKLQQPAPENSQVPSNLKKLQNRLKGNFFEDLDRNTSNEDVLARLAEDERFSANYAHLKHTLEVIFALDESSVNESSVDVSGTVSDWDAAQESSQFQALEARYGYFQNTPENQGEALHALFKKLAISCRIMIVLFEQNNTPNDTMAYDYAYKIMALFVDPTQEINITQLFNSIAPKVYKLLTQRDTKTDKAFHDTFIVKLQRLPDARLLSDMPGWRALIAREGQKAFLFFKMAKRIEDKIAEETQQAPRAPKDLKEAKVMEALCAYGRAPEDLAFAELCRANKVSESCFNACLDYMAESPGWPKKLTDNIPNHQIQGREAAEGFAWVKLPEGDKRALILGDITDCCQSIEGDSEQCVKDAVSLGDNGLYVLLKQRKTGDRAPLVNGALNTQDFELVGQAYLWRSITGNLCLDSIECLRDSISNIALQSILQDFATQVINENPDIHFVTLGQGGNTPRDLFDRAPIPEVMRQGVAYGDASSQYNIEALGAEMQETLPVDTGPEKFRNCINYLRSYLRPYPSDTARFVDELRKLIAEIPSLQHEMTPELLRILLSLTPTLTLDDLRPVDFDALDDMSREARSRTLKDIPLGRLVWMQKTPEALFRAIRYLPDEQEANVLMTLYQSKPRFVVGYLATYFDEIQSIKTILPVIVKSVSSFTKLIQGLSLEQCKYLFPRIQDELKELIKTGNDFNHMMEFLSSEQRIYLFDFMKGELKGLIKTGNDFYCVMAFASSEQRTYVFDLMKGELKGLIKTGDDFNYIMAFASVEQRMYVFDLMKGELKGLIKTSNDLYRVMENLSPDQCGVLLSVMQHDLKDLIKTHHEFILLMKKLSPDQCGVLLSVMQEDLKVFIKTISDLMDVMKKLSPEQRPYLFEAMKNELKDLIKTGNDLHLVMESFSSEQRSYLFEAMKNKLKDLIKTGNDLHLVMQYLSPEQRDFVFHVKQEDLKYLINTYYDFTLVMQYLSPDQRDFVFQEKQDDLKYLINTYHDFTLVMQYLSPEQRTYLLKAMKNELKDLIKNSYDFTRVMQALSPEQRTYLLEAMKNELKDLIKNSDDFIRVMKDLSPEQRTYLFEAMKHELKDLITTRRDFNRVMQALSPEQCGVLLEAMKNELKDRIKNSDDFTREMQYLSPEQRPYLFEAMKNELKDLIKNSDDFTRVMQYLSPKKCSYLFEAMKHELKDLIKNRDDFTRVMQALSPKQCEVLLEAMKNELKDLIKNRDDFTRVMQYLSPEQRPYLFEAMKNELQDLIKNSDDLIHVMAFILPEQRTCLFEAKKNELKDLIKNRDDFNDVMALILPEQRSVVFDAIKDKVIDWIETVDDFCVVMKLFPPERGANFFDTKMHDLNDLINTIYDFNRAIEVLSSEQAEILIHLMKDKFNGFFKKNSYAFNQLIEKLSTERLGVFLDVMHDELYDRIKTSFVFQCVTQGLPQEKIALFIKHGGGILSRACADGVVDFAKFLIEKGVQPTEAMLLNACSDGKLELAQLLASKLIPDVIANLSSQGASYDFDQVAFYVGGINQENLASLAETGLQAFILNQQASTQTLTAKFNEELDETKPSEAYDGEPSRRSRPGF